MRTRVTLRRASGATADVTITTDAGATVGDVAEAVARAEGARLAAGVTLLVEPPEGGEPRTAVTRSGLADAGLRAGSTISVVPAAERYPERRVDPGLAVARLSVVTGPAAGLHVDLPPGVTTIGRGAASDVRLDDPMVSKVHARLVVGETVEIVDAGSSNGIVIGGGRVDRAVLSGSDYVLVGESVVRVEPLGRADPRGADGATVPFNRAPRVVAAYADRTVDAPTVPEPAPPGRFPLLALVAPLAMGAVLFATTRSTLSLVFVALSPLIMAGTWLDRRLTDRRRLAQLTGEFGRALTALEGELGAGQQSERAARLAAMPATAEAVAAAGALGPLLWSRRPEHDEFLRARVGTGSARSRTTVVLPPRGKAVAELRAALERVVERFERIDGVPLVVDLREVGAVGVAGLRQDVDPVARSLVAQLVCLHSPAELVVAGVASAASAPRWDWLKWLPHVDSPHSPLGGAHLASSPAAAAALATRLEELVAARRVARPPVGTLPAVLLVVEDDARAERGRLVRLAEDGPAVGVHVLWCADAVERLPAVCRAFVAVDGGRTRLGAVGAGRWSDVAAEPLDVPTATALARRLASVVDAGAPTIDESDLPRSVGYLALAGHELAQDAAAVVERWRETGSLVDRSGGSPVRRRLDAGLRAVVGLGASGEFVLDLRSQGPHALVGGTTGAGKSEFLQSWVLGLAAAHSPDRVSFLFVDYKGGAAFADCVDLPHTVGLVTDLSPHLVRRALTSLRAELRHRERLLERKKAKDLLALERSGDPETPPALVIVVDEFAALVAEMPEFVDGVVDVAQRGRSLGLHLVLATQRPAGVIKDNLRANTNLRVALRMADEHDSVDVLGSPLAAHFDPAIPGRGAVRTGPGLIALFQAGYAGGRTAATARGPAVGLESLTFGPGEPWDVPADPSADEVDDAGPSDVARVVRTVRAAARREGVPAPRRPWLPELPALIDLGALGPSTDDALALGVADVPSEQAQRVLRYRPDVDGCVAVLGTSGAGKSAVLRTIAAAAGMAGIAGTAGGPGSASDGLPSAGSATGAGSAGPSRAGPVHVDALDFGTGGLAMLASLPHVGAVVDASDGERVARLLRRLRDELDDRSVRYAQAHAGTIAEYRTLAGRPDEPRLLLLLDGLAAFRDAYEVDPARAHVWSAFQRVVAEGRPLGVHVVMAVERPGALPASLAGSVQRRLVLRQADDAAYALLDVPKDVLGAASPPGRGVLAGETDELQVAVPGGAAAPAEQAHALERLAARVRAAGVAPAPPVGRLPSWVDRSSMPADVGGLPVLGVADDTLEPVGFAPRGTFALAGPPGSGRTTALRSLAASVRRALPGARLCYVGNRRSPVHAAGIWDDVALDAERAAELARAILPDLSAPAVPRRPVVVVVEALADLLGGPAEHLLTDAVRAARRQDHLVIAENETGAWGSSWPLVAEVRGGRRGLVLQPDHLDGDTLFRTPFPRSTRAEFPPGRGVFVEQGRLRRVQVPVAE